MRTIEGRNPVLEAMKAGQNINRIMIQEGTRGKSVDDVIKLAGQLKIRVENASKSKLSEMAKSETHQGVVAFASDYKYVDIDDILEYAEKKGEAPFVVVLDEIQDPYNLGSIIRTANVAGVHGVIIPKHRAASVTAVVSKTSAGAVEHMNVAQVTNTARAVEELKEKGLWIVAGALGGDQTIYETDLKGPLGIVVGSEGEGVRRLVRDKSDFLVQIPMYGEVNSLNASVAAGIMIYEAVRQRRIGK